MFNNCKKLNNLNLSNFITLNVTDISYMFNDCISLINLNLDNFISEKTNDIDGIFNNCHKLKKNNIISKDNKILERIK